MKNSIASHRIVINYCTATLASVATGLMVSHSAPANATNLIYNGDFSSGLNGWDTVNTTLDLTTNPTSALIGDNYSYIFQYISTTPDISTQYQGSFDLLNPASNDLDSVAVYIKNYGYDTLSNLIASGQATLTVTGSGSSTVDTISWLFNSSGYSSGYYGLDSFGNNTANDYFGMTNYGINPINVTNITINAVATAAVPEPFTVVGTFIGGTAALRMRKKLKSARK